MTSQTGQTINHSTHSTNISRSKGNQAMKFGQLINYNVRNFFFKNYAEYEARRLVPGLFLFFKKSYTR